MWANDAYITSNYYDWKCTPSLVWVRYFFCSCKNNFISKNTHMGRPKFLSSLRKIMIDVLKEPQKYTILLQPLRNILISCNSLYPNHRRNCRLQEFNMITIIKHLVNNEFYKHYKCIYAVISIMEININMKWFSNCLHRLLHLFPQNMFYILKLQEKKQESGKIGWVKLLKLLL